MTLPCRHKIRNSIPDDLRPNTLPFGHGSSPNIKSLRVSGEEAFVSLKPECQSGVRTSDLPLSMQTALTTALGFPPLPAFGKGQQLLCYVCLVFLHNEDILDRSISGMTPIKCDKFFLGFYVVPWVIDIPRKKVSHYWFHYWSTIICFIHKWYLRCLYIIYKIICWRCQTLSKYKVKTRCTFPSEWS